MCSDQERAKRQKAMDFAIENTRLEGGTVSPEARAIMKKWVDGELSDDEMICYWCESNPSKDQS